MTMYSNELATSDLTRVLMGRLALDALLQPTERINNDLSHPVLMHRLALGAL